MSDTERTRTSGNIAVKGDKEESKSMQEITVARRKYRFAVLMNCKISALGKKFHHVYLEVLI